MYTNTGNIVRLLVATALGALLTGCASLSPLESPDPAVRKQAVEGLTDQKALFFAAMNIKVGFEGKFPELYSSTHLRKGEYTEDVRILAVQKLEEPEYLLRCAFWRDGDVYRDDGADQGRLSYGGEKYNIRGGASCLCQAVFPGDAVRAAAEARIADIQMLKKVSLVIGAIDPKTACEKAGVLPCGFRSPQGNYVEYKKDDSLYFERYYEPPRPGNPLDALMVRVLEKQALPGVVSFLYNAGVGGPIVTPQAFAAAIPKVGKVSGKVGSALFRRICMDGDKLRERIPSEMVSALFSHVDNPDAALLDAYIGGLKGCGAGDLEKILAKISDKKLLRDAAMKLLGGKKTICGKYVSAYPNEKRVCFRLPYSTLDELKPDAARELVRALADEDALAELALRAELFSIRLAAAEKVKNPELLFRIATDALNDCPIDTSLEEYYYGVNGIDWSNAAERKSRANLRKVAIDGIADIATLKKVRNAVGDQLTKQIVSKRIGALGGNDLDELLSYEKYDADLFTYLGALNDKDVMLRLAKEAKLKGVRLMAARGLGTKEYSEFAAKELPEGIDDVPEDVVHLGPFRLDMPVEDALAEFAALVPELDPRLYLDGKTLCIAAGRGRDIAWAGIDTMKVHWLTLTTPVVQKVLGVGDVSFDDLRATVCSKCFGGSGKNNVISKNAVRQAIIDYTTTGGVTARYFSGALKYGEDFSRTLRKFSNSHADNGGAASGLANALENAVQDEQNAKDAASPRFAPQGSIQILYTKDAVKGEF